MKKRTLMIVALLLVALLAFQGVALAEEGAKKEFTIARAVNPLDQSTDTNTKLAMQMAEEALGIHINWIDIPNSSVNERKAVLLQDPPDAFMGIIGTSDIMRDYDAFYPITDILATAAPDLYEDYQSISNWQEFMTYPNGNIYSCLASIHTQYNSWTIGVHFINQVWLENLGLEMPTTTDELYEVLKAFKEQDANGNGDPNDEIPLSFCENEFQSHLSQFMGWFGFNPGPGMTEYYKVVNGTVVPTANTPEMRAFIEFMNKLAAEGLLDVEGFSQTSEQFRSKIRNGVVGSLYGWTPGTFMGPELSVQYQQVLPLKASTVDVDPVVYGQKHRFMAVTAGFTITSACEDPEALLEWYNYLGSSTEMKLTTWIGERGLLWDFDDEGKPYYKNPPASEDFTFENMKYTYGIMQSVPMLLQPEIPYEDPETSPENYGRMLSVQAAEPWIPEEGFLAFSRIVGEEAYEDLNSYSSDLTSFINNFVSTSIVNGLTDEAWEKYVNDLTSYRYNDFIQWYQDYLDGTI